MIDLILKITLKFFEILKLNPFKGLEEESKKVLIISFMFFIPCLLVLSVLLFQEKKENKLLRATIIKRDHQIEALMRETSLLRKDLKANQQFIEKYNYKHKWAIKKLNKGLAETALKYPNIAFSIISINKDILDSTQDTYLKTVNQEVAYDFFFEALYGDFGAIGEAQDLKETNPYYSDSHVIFVSDKEDIKFIESLENLKIQNISLEYSLNNGLRIVTEIYSTMIRKDLKWSKVFPLMSPVTDTTILLFTATYSSDQVSHSKAEAGALYLRSKVVSHFGR